ncbi:SIR2 family NAD-dependent protein deacylase [Sulfurospirillum arcachonense]|uniref:SIR2 family NAD-dependent protein deacylase n=1 Tax=Sulfurospirillum arcachonense TaxID=57666 RepID=UPI000468317A|nr:Sir2 family NAD-dependent protein deacetylase [Sulfurospirillum arcachonense]
MSKIVIFSGAGVSADSGISTFRDSDGLWEKHDVKDICTAGCLITNREETLAFYDARREDIQNKKPNLAHITIAKLKNKYPDKIAVITQNVDDMFERAGCSDVLHVHGFLRELCCEKCNLVKDIGYEKQSREELCPQCNEKLRPNIVFFGEQAPRYADLYKHLEDCEVFVSIGTSGAVINVDMFTQWAEYSILNNLEKSNLINEEYFDEVYYEKAVTAIPKIELSLKKFLLD